MEKNNTIPLSITNSNYLDYSKLQAKQLVILIIEKDNEEAAIYLLYVKYDKDIRFYAMRYYDSLEYLEDLTDDIYIQFKGKKSDWEPLKSFHWRCSFRTWYCSVVSHLFLQKRKELIGLGNNTVPIDKEGNDNGIESPIDSDEINPNKIILLEAINRLSNPDYRFILIKELEGYSPDEIAIMLTKKRRLEGRLKIRIKEGTEIIPTADYVYMMKGRALKEVKQLVDQIKIEWYGN